MSEQDYDAERARLHELYGQSSAEAAAKRDQALALLFYRSGWTQEELAKKEDKSQSQIQRQLLFGRFLNFTPKGVNLESAPAKVTERAFRKIWEQTDKSELNERIRFDSVIELMREQSAIRQPQRKKIGGGRFLFDQCCKSCQRSGSMARCGRPSTTTLVEGTSQWARRLMPSLHSTSTVRPSSGNVIMSSQSR
jgi:hypothetical protein